MSTKSIIKLKKNKVLDLMWHEDSTIVFKDKLAVGRFDSKAPEPFIPFDEECLAQCEKYKFKYDPALLNQESEPEPEPTDKEESDEDFKETEPELPNEDPQASIVSSSNHSSIRDLTSEFESKIYAFVDKLQQAYSEEVTNLKLQIVSLEKEREGLNHSLNEIQRILRRD